MSEKLKIALWIIAGIVGAVLLFSLVVCISCSVNGFTFGEQVCSWFGGNSSAVETTEIVEDVASIAIR